MEHILEFLKWVAVTYGKETLIVVMLILVSAFLIYKGILKKPKRVEKLILRIKNISEEVTKSKLRNHSIFSKAVLYKYRAKAIAFPGKYYKTKLFQLFFLTKVEVDIRILKFFLNNKGFKKMSRYRLQTLMTDAVQDMAEQFNDVIKVKLRKFSEVQINVFRKNYTLDEINIFVDKLYEYVMHQEGGYVEKRKLRMDRIYIHIEDIPLNILYNNNYERIYRFIDIISMVIDGAITDATRTFEHFNGQLDSFFNVFIMEGHYPNSLSNLKK